MATINVYAVHCSYPVSEKSAHCRTSFRPCHKTFRHSSLPQRALQARAREHERRRADYDGGQNRRLINSPIHPSWATYGPLRTARGHPGNYFRTTSATGALRCTSAAQTAPAVRASCASRASFRRWSAALPVSSTSLEKSETGSSSSRCGGACSARLPASKSMISLESMTVCSRWAMVSTVHSSKALRMAVCSTASVSLSMEAW
eukprot:scaffold5289_cov60-Phaeocystis_antarctica.AAC.5